MFEDDFESLLMISSKMFKECFQISLNYRSLREQLLKLLSKVFDNMDTYLSYMLTYIFRHGFFIT